MKAFITFALSLFAAGAAHAAAPRTYDAEYTATMRPEAGVIAVALKLSGKDLPSKLRLQIDPKRHKGFQSKDPLEVADKEVIWRPRGKVAELRYEFTVNHERSPKRFDSMMTKDWALFRGDRMVPLTRVTAKQGLTARSTMTFVLPDGWSIATPFAPHGTRSFAFDDPKRRFDRPRGWMLAGKIGVRAEKIGPVQATIAAPVGESTRRQDMLSFLNWNLPRLLEVFTDFPQRVLIVSAGDPMWRGGLSGPSSLYVHADRSLVSENRTSTLIHELVHVATGIYADHESDWIVEGIAEYYSIETLRRSGGISARRYEQAIVDMERWAAHTKTLFGPSSSGHTTLRAVLVLLNADEEIRSLTKGKRSFDDVARELAKDGGEVSLERLQKVAAQIAGKRLASLERSRLQKAPAAPKSRFGGSPAGASSR
jgi:predicted metalloprotease with PDZ domain